MEITVTPTVSGGSGERRVHLRVIPDLGHAIVWFEEISELAAIRLEDEPRWNGRIPSSGPRNAGASRWFVPAQIRGSETEAVYIGILRSLSEVTRLLHDPLTRFLSARDGPEASLNPADHGQARFGGIRGVARRLLPLAAKTSLGQIVSMPTLHKQITRMMSSQLSELRAIAEDVHDVCRRRPVDVGDEGVPLNPAEWSGYQESVYGELARHAKNALRGTDLDLPASWGQTTAVDLIEPHAPLDELVATLIYRVSHAPYRKILSVVKEWSDTHKRETIDVATRQRGTEDTLLKEFRSGYAFQFDLLMDIGAWRDMHRHRRYQQVQQNFTTIHGYDIPSLLVDARLDQEYRQAMDAVRHDLDLLKKSDQEASLYATPFGFKVRSLWKIDYADINQWLSDAGNDGSYRTIARQMQHQLAQRVPVLAERLQGAPPRDNGVTQ